MYGSFQKSKDISALYPILRIVTPFPITDNPDIILHGTLGTDLNFSVQK
jgi:hypothetical protein